MKFLLYRDEAHMTPVEKLARFSDAGTKREGWSVRRRIGLIKAANRTRAGLPAVIGFISCQGNSLHLLSNCFKGTK
jgi:hypothetical protein